MEDMGAVNTMISDWFGNIGLIGIRYYVTTRIGIDLKIGFMNNGYKADKWRLNNVDVKGPTMNLDERSVFALNIVYGLK